MRLDKDTKEVIKDGTELELMLKSEGWDIARKKLISRLADVESIRNFDRTGKTNEEIISEMNARHLAVEIVEEWFSEIDGDIIKVKNFLALEERTKTNNINYEEENSQDDYS